MLELAIPLSNSKIGTLLVHSNKASKSLETPEDLLTNEPASGKSGMGADSGAMEVGLQQQEKGKPQ